MVLIDARHFGRMLKYARSQNHMGQAEFAKLLKISQTDLRAFERGSKIISDGILMRLFIYGVVLLKAHHTRFNPDILK